MHETVLYSHSDPIIKTWWRRNARREISKKEIAMSEKVQPPATHSEKIIQFMIKGPLRPGWLLHMIVFSFSWWARRLILVFHFHFSSFHTLVLVLRSVVFHLFFFFYFFCLSPVPFIGRSHCSQVFCFLVAGHELIPPLSAWLFCLCWNFRLYFFGFSLSWIE